MHWIVYAMMFVNTVDTKIKAPNALKSVSMLFVDTVNTKIKACNAFNAICQSSQYKTHSHISAHNFLNIQLIWHPQIVLESWDWGLFNHTTQYYICRHCWHKTWISNAFNAMYVDTVNTKHLYTFLPITLLIFTDFQSTKSFGKLRLWAFQPYHQILYMLTLLMLGISISTAFLPITFLRSHPNSFFCVCWHCRQTT